jgi:four helix bundle protein
VLGQWGLGTGKPDLRERTMAFEVYEVSIELIRALRPIVGRLGTRDSKLADEIRRAATSVALNLGEGNRKRGKSRLSFFRIAAGSANEVRAGLEVAEAWGYLEEEETQDAAGLVDRVLAMLWRLAGPS